MGRALHRGRPLDHPADPGVLACSALPALRAGGGGCLGGDSDPRRDCTRVRGTPAERCPAPRQELLIAKRHQALREAVEKALSSLGYVRGRVSGPGVTMAQFLILLRAASRIGAAAVTLSELPVQAEDGPERAVDVRAQRLVAAEELETACRSVAVALLAGRGEVPLGPIQARITELIALLGEEAGEVLAYAQAMRHLESAAEALDTLYGGGRAHPRVHIGVRRPWPLADTLET